LKTRKLHLKRDFFTFSYSCLDRQVSLERLGQQFMLLTACPLKKLLSVIVTKSWWKVDDNNSLLVGDPQGILGKLLRLCPIH
jgi:hypothetical protein